MGSVRISLPSENTLLVTCEKGSNMFDQKDKFFSSVKLISRQNLNMRIWKKRSSKLGPHCIKA